MAEVLVNGFEASPAGQSLTAGSPFIPDTFLINEGGAMAGGIFTAPSDGPYIVIGTYSGSSSTSNCSLYRNGSYYRTGYYHEWGGIQSVWSLSLNQGDTVFMASGVSDTTLDTPSQNWMTVATLTDACIWMYRGYRSTTYLLAAETQDMVWDVEEINAGSCVAAGVFTAPTDGVYMFNVFIKPGVPSNDRATVTLYLNGTEYKRATYNAGGYKNYGIFVEKMNGGDTMRFRNYTSGGDVTVQAGASISRCHILKMP